jgi:hypothetical protein
MQTLLLYRSTLRRGPMCGLAIEQTETQLATLLDSPAPRALPNVQTSRVKKPTPPVV